MSSEPKTENSLTLRMADATKVLESALDGRTPKPSWAQVLKAFQVFQENPKEKEAKPFIITFAQLKGKLSLDDKQWMPTEKTPEEILIDQAKQTIKEHYKDRIIFGNLAIFEKGVRGIRFIDPCVVEIGQPQFAVVGGEPRKAQTRFLRFNFADYGFHLTLGLEDLKKILQELEE